MRKSKFIARRSVLQFSLRSLLVVVCVAALAISLAKYWVNRDARLMAKQILSNPNMPDREKRLLLAFLSKSRAIDRQLADALGLQWVSISRSGPQKIERIVRPNCSIVWERVLDNGMRPGRTIIVMRAHRIDQITEPGVSSSQTLVILVDDSDNLVDWALLPVPSRGVVCTLRDNTNAVQLDVTGRDLLERIVCTIAIEADKLKPRQIERMPDSSLLDEALSDMGIKRDKK